MSPEERAILASLDKIDRADAIRAGIEPMVERVQLKPTQDPGAVMAWEPTPLVLYDESVPVFMR